MKVSFHASRPEREPLSDPFLVTLYAKREVRVSGALCVLTYEEALVRLKTRAGAVAICGAGLSLKSFYPDEMRITGRIDAVTLEGGKE